jgi:hypothetical protein
MKLNVSTSARRRKSGRLFIDADRTLAGESAEERLVIRKINPRMNRPRNCAETIRLLRRVILHRRQFNRAANKHRVVSVRRDTLRPCS